MIDMSNTLIQVDYTKIHEFTEDDLKCKECLISKLGENFKSILLEEYGVVFEDEMYP